MVMTKHKKHRTSFKITVMRSLMRKVRCSERFHFLIIILSMKQVKKENFQKRKLRLFFDKSSFDY